jgi:hypothetical protein
MATPLDTRRIRHCTPSQLRDYYKALLQSTSVDAGTEQILAAIERGSIKPKCFGAWLGAAKSPTVIKRGLQQTFSVIIRESTIKHLGKAFGSVGWRSTWNGLQRTPGLLNLFSDLSVNEVRLACKLLGKCGKGSDVEDKRRYITELFKGLQPHIFSDAPFKTTDRRPLTKFYRYLIPSCTEEIVERIVTGSLAGKWKPIKDEYLMRYHPEVIRQEQLRALERKPDATINRKRLQELITQYPKAGNRNPRFSPSMDFSLHILRKVAAEETSELDGDIFINDLVRPLLSRAVKKKVPWSAIKEILDLTIHYLEKHPGAGKEITDTEGDVRHLVALCWAKKPDIFEKHLRKLLSDPTFGTRDRDRLTDWDDFMNKIPNQRRYALLRICFYESTGLDIDKHDDLKKMKGGLSDDLLNKFTAREALDILSRMPLANGTRANITIYRGDTVLNVATKFKGYGGDPELYLVYLMSRVGDGEQARELARQRITDRKKAAEKGSEPEQRTFYAKCALHYAIASGDLQMYSEVLDWTKRFLQDPLVFRQLYAQSYHKEVYTLLSGIPNNCKNVTTSEVQGRVTKANAIMQNMFDTACSAIREPSFQTGDWHGTFNLFHLVVQERIKNCAKLRKQLEASDQEMYTMFWEDMIQVLLEMEKKAHRNEFSQLEANGLRGPLDSVRESHIDLQTKELSIYRFFNDLARRRDEFWQELRPTVHPAVLTLPKPYPRGLPLQHLTAPWDLTDTHDLVNFAPYIASRAKAVVFPDPAEVMIPVPDDDETAAAIGPFVDSYQYALKLHIPETGDKHQGATRLHEAWSYAIGPLSSGRMDGDEAERFWREMWPGYFTVLLPPPKPNVLFRTWPTIPEVEDPTQPHEWNPFEASRPDCPSRTFDKLTYLDVSLVIRDVPCRVEDIWSKIEDCEHPQIPADEEGTHEIWSPRRDMGDGGVLSALLYLEMLYGASNGRLLEKPFPSEDDARYPSMYLDEAFQGSSLNRYNAVRHIRGHLHDVPPALLHLSAKNMLSELGASDKAEHGDGSVLELAMTLLVRLGESDRPSLAREFAVNTILDRPTASSWHRQLLKPSLLRRMPGSEAKSCFKLFADAIIHRMPTGDSKRVEQGSNPVSPVSPDSSHATEAAKSPAESFVKVTTIKFLAQILRDTEMADEDSAFAILSTMLMKGTHIDVRLNTTKTLLAMLVTCSEELADKILVALESLIPIAGNLNERKFVSETDWVVAAQTLVLPEYPDIDGHSPTTKLFVDHYRAGSGEPERRRMFIDRILLPTLDYFQQQIARFISLFLRKHGLEDTEVQVPRAIHYATTLLDSDDARFLPRTYLEDFVTYFTFKLTPPPPIQALHDKLNADPTLYLQPDSFTWGSLYGSNPDLIHIFRRSDPLMLFDKPTLLPANIGITPDVISTQYLRLFIAVLTADAPLYKRLESSFLPDLLNGTYLPRSWWSTHGAPLLKQMITHIESKRTSDWQRDPHRHPSVLPDTFPLRLLLLNFPWPGTSASTETFISQLTHVIAEMRTSGIYHKKLDQLKHFLSLDPVSTTDDRSRERKIGFYTLLDQKPDPKHEELVRNRMEVALGLGKGATDVLNVEVAVYLLELAEEEWKDVDKGVKERVKGMVEGWRKCGEEEVRRLGWGVEWVFK